MTSDDTFWKVHDALPQQAPGSKQTTLHLLKLANKSTGKALDVGCGQGRASLLLAKLGMEVTAVDTHQPFLDQLKVSAQVDSVEDTVIIKNIAMEKLKYPEATFDLIWSEGAAYLMGLKKAMSSWRQFLKPDGLLVITECCWLTNTPSNEVVQFWARNYPNMPDVTTVTENAVKSGYNISHTYKLPRSDWDAYYLPMKKIVSKLEKIIVNDTDAIAVLSDKKQEIRMYEEYGDEYGYVGFVLRKND